MRRVLIIIVVTLTLSSSAHAELFIESEDKGALINFDDLALSGYTEVGKRSTSEDYEEEDTDDDYTYQNYHLRLEGEVADCLAYDFSSFIYDKDYAGRDALDNISRIFKTNWRYYQKKLKEESLRTDIGLKYKEKRYKNKPRNEYDELRVEPSVYYKKKDVYTLSLAVGVDKFDYSAAGEKDQLKIFAKVSGDHYFLEKKLLLKSSYRIEQLEKKKDDQERTKQDVMGGFDYAFDFPWIDRVGSRIEWGERDTKDEDERDEDYDYKYWQFLVKTVHKITPKLKTYLKYQCLQKDYLTADLDNEGFYIQNNWNYEILEDKQQRIGLNWGVQHKDVRYTLKSGNDYRKETFEVNTSYKRKKNWGTSLGLEADFYDFDDAGDDKRRYYLRLSGEKILLEGDMVVALDFKHKCTTYKQKNDKGQEAVRMSFQYKF
ncbi:MAG: hypothetical protein V1872_12495 [bacterium]